MLYSFILLTYLRTWLANIRHVRIRIFTYVPSLTYGTYVCTLHGSKNVFFCKDQGFWSKIGKTNWSLPATIPIAKLFLGLLQYQTKIGNKNSLFAIPIPTSISKASFLPYQYHLNMGKFCDSTTSKSISQSVMVLSHSPGMQIYILWGFVLQLLFTAALIFNGAKKSLSLCQTGFFSPKVPTFFLIN